MCFVASSQPLCYLDDGDEILIDVVASTSRCNCARTKAASGGATPVAFAALRVRSSSYLVLLIVHFYLITK